MNLCRKQALGITTQLILHRILDRFCVHKTPTKDYSSMWVIRARLSFGSHFPSESAKSFLSLTISMGNNIRGPLRFCLLSVFPYLGSVHTEILFVCYNNDDN